MVPTFLIGFDSHDILWRLFKDTVLVISMAVYLISRVGIVALVFSCLRLLPEGPCRAIQWATSIPHFLKTCGHMPQRNSHLFAIQTGISSKVIRASSITGMVSAE